MKPFDTITEAIEWLNTTPGVCAGSQSVIVRFWGVTFIYVDHEFGWIIETQCLMGDTALAA